MGTNNQDLIIEVYYNRKRMHSTNDYLLPVEYENQFKLA